ncbi:ketoacyl-ACP synthase III [Alphaproteobacteria bacterium]|jgi:3-oxoacyl-[acyl-carrier-protein] synthase III|nr:ketoacyl-ACP synthase III [Alphaproteobacteria bacterium]MBT5798965.1 ketoacyl-ACP synthase III [Alphaproteobacteria bacterium]MDA9190296.1 ketoacyl-ACP synthase III [Alphaproteobacteria bacterium]MDC0395253.1 ketoacyl-ACP synthase III [Alphaproteobacteria bacterium]MDC0461501.1 ketoacyl-ACP synthase III [Alphaproteobacteria bacterium]
MKQILMTGVGSYLPETILTNNDLSQFVDTNDSWIKQRTGIESRRKAKPEELTSDLAVRAAEKALHSAGLAANDIDCIIVATTTPDCTFPATATIVQNKLGAFNAFAFDVQAVCAGFVYALSVANGLMSSGQGKNTLVIGAETFTKLLDWSDRSTCVLFGDGAGAVVLQAEESEDGYGIIANTLHSDGRYKDILYVDGGVSSTGSIGHVRMQGRDVFKHAVEKLAAAMDEVLSIAELTADDIDWLVPHQANVRIINAMQKKLNLADEKVIKTVSTHANTSAASIPLALAAGVEAGKIKPGHLLALEAIGGGLSWGACLVRFGRPG